MPRPKEEAAILAKSLALLVRIRNGLSQLDECKFPSSSTGDARQLVDAALSALEKPDNLNALSPEVLYCNLFRIQNLVNGLYASSIDRISWPIVNYCDEIRKIFFTDGQTKIFYSLTEEHNYSIAPFSVILRHYLAPLLPSKELDLIFSGPRIFALDLASSEDNNLPSYANIGHEFGHALFSVKRGELAGMFAPCFQKLLLQAQSEWESEEPGVKSARLEDLSLLLFLGFGQELYCDLVGALLMGPAFFLSLYEMAWGGPKNLWRANIESSYAGYPSVRFRLSCIKAWCKLDEFRGDATREFAKLGNPALRAMPVFLEEVPCDDSDDELHSVDKRARPDAIAHFLGKNLPEIKGAYMTFLGSARERLVEEYEARLQGVSPRNIAELLHRLEFDILPNIIPDKTLLGKPAGFQDILNAAAMARLAILLKENASGSGPLHSELQKIERLTAKALEVSYIQREYENRSH